MVDFGSRNKAYAQAISNARSNSKLDPISWNTVLDQKTVKDLAESIRIQTMRCMVIMERVHYRNPAYIVQWALDNEKLARKIEKCSCRWEVVILIHDRVGIMNIRRGAKR